MNDELNQKVAVVLEFFYGGLFQESYFASITKIIDDNEVLPIIDERLLEEVTLT